MPEVTVTLSFFYSFNHNIIARLEIDRDEKISLTLLSFLFSKIEQKFYSQYPHLRIFKP